MRIRNIKLLAYLIGTLVVIALAGLVTLLDPENILFHIICFILFLFCVLFCILVLLNFILAQVFYKIALRIGHFNTEIQKLKHKAYFELSGEKLKEKLRQYDEDLLENSNIATPILDALLNEQIFISKKQRNKIIEITNEFRKTSID